MTYLFSSTGANGAVYSCDKIILNFKLRAGGCTELFRSIEQDLLLQVAQWETRKVGAFRYQFTVQTMGGTFWLGCCLNTYGRLNDTYARLEFNPNKVGGEPELVAMVRRLYRHSARSPQLKQFDLAVDLPVQRESVFLRKDRRRYEEVRNSFSDRTQYLGPRNDSGRVKVYNKAAEQRIVGPLTRVELTIGFEDCSFQRVRDLWPQVLCLAVPAQLRADIQQLPETDRFILLTLLAEPERLGELGRRKRDRMEALLADYAGVLPLDVRAYNAVLSYVLGWITPLCPV